LQAEEGTRASCGGIREVEVGGKLTSRFDVYLEGAASSLLYGSQAIGARERASGESCAVRVWLAKCFHFLYPNSAPHAHTHTHLFAFRAVRGPQSRHQGQDKAWWRRGSGVSRKRSGPENAALPPIRRGWLRGRGSSWPAPAERELPTDPNSLGVKKPASLSPGAKQASPPRAPGAPTARWRLERT
jgi:hypothetical protein